MRPRAFEPPGFTKRWPPPKETGYAAQRIGATRPIKAMSAEPVTIKQYGGRRLYHPVAGCYVALEDLALMVEDDEDFVVYEARTGEDITRSILHQIILERAKHG